MQMDKGDLKAEDHFRTSSIIIFLFKMQSTEIRNNTSTISETPALIYFILSSFESTYLALLVYHIA